MELALLRSRGPGLVPRHPLLHEVRQGGFLPRHVAASCPPQRVQAEGSALPRHSRGRPARRGARGELDQAGIGAARLGPIAPASDGRATTTMKKATTTMKKTKSGSKEGKGDSPSQLIDARIKELSDWRGETLARVRILIKQADPEVVEEWKWRRVPVWSHAGMICTGETYKNVVKLTFAKGASL